MLPEVNDSLDNLITSGSAVGLLLLALDLALQGRQETNKGKGFWLAQLHLALGVAAMLPLAVMLAGVRGDWCSTLFALAFYLALGEQLIGRYLFYERLNERTL